MTRTTKREVNGAFEALLRAIKGRKAESWNDVGGYDLTHNGTYGGYVIERVHDVHGSITRPFGDQHRPAGEMYSALWFAVGAIDQLKRPNGSS